MSAFARSKIDIVFIIDRSGSMGGSISNVLSNINTFCDQLSGRGIDFRLGLVSYEYYPTRYEFTDNVNVFKQYLNNIVIDGGTENGLDAIMDAKDQYPFDVNSSKYFILIGDEVVTSDRGYSIDSVRSELVSSNIKLTAIGINDVSGQFRQLSDPTGGLYLDLYSNFNENLNTIFQQIQQIPTMEVVSPYSGQLVSENSIIPMVRASDPDSDWLTFRYYIDGETSPRDEKSVGNSATAQTVSFNSLNMSAITEGSHSIRFTVSDSSATVQDAVSIFVDKSAPTIGNVNMTSSDSQITVSGSATDSAAGLEGSPYRYTIGGQTSGWTVLPFFTVSGLTPNAPYNAKFEARDKAGHISVTEQTVYTKAQVPGITAQAIGETSLQLSLSAQNASGTQYLIQSGSSYVSSDGRLVSSPVWISPSAKKVTLTGLSSNTGYTFRAKARNSAGVETDYGSAASGTTLAVSPSNIVLSASQQWIKLTWPATPGAAGYDVETDGAVNDNGMSTTYQHNGLSPNTQHSYRVRVRNAGGAGSWSEYLTKLTLPDPPAIPGHIAAAPSQRQVTLSWDLVPKATKYEVEADGIVIDNGSSNSYIYPNLQPLTDHTYRIRASNAGGTSEWSPVIQQQTWPDPPSTPSSLSATISIHTVDLKWDQMDGATGYEIEVDGMILENKDATTYLHKDLDALSGHTYRVRAKNIGGKSAWSAPLDVTTHPEIPAIPTNIMTTFDQTTITLSWYAVPYAESYEVEIDGKTVQPMTENAYFNDGLEPDTKHTYRIRATNISGAGEWSKPVTMTTMPEGTDTMSLTNMAAVVTNKSIILSWDTVSENARYDIEVDGKLLDNGADTIYNHTGLGPDEFHIYKIRVKQGTETGGWIAVLALSTLPNLPDAPGKMDGYAKDSSIELHWQKIEGATGYQLEIDGKTVNIAGGTSYIHQDLDNGTAHTYRIRATNVTGVTAWSPALQKSTTSPDYTLAVNKDGEYSFSLLGANVQDFSELHFTVTYDPNQLELVDLYDYTPGRDLANGAIPGSNLSANVAGGKITLTINQNVVPGTSWSGEITTLLFKSKINGIANIHVTAD